ncbi:MAG: Sec-independent protein translocase subunit TatA [Thiotrichaceae bacterium]|nr:Sec-independent protein translocase subunit TatA [Thiotrichaceae bacterium]
MLYGFGLGGISPWSLLIILVIVVVIFGTKRLRNAGGDLGGAVKNFKDSMKTGENEAKKAQDAKKEAIEDAKDDVIDVASKVKDSTKS